MFGRLLRVTGTVLVIAVALVTPVLVTSAPASADTVVDGCTIVSNPTPTNFTNCPGVDFTGGGLSVANLSGVDLSYANLAGAVFTSCLVGGVSCVPVNLSGANFTNANLSGVSFVNCTSPGGSESFCLDTTPSGANFTNANLSNAVLASCFSGVGGAQCLAATVGGAVFAQANLSNATLASCIEDVFGTTTCRAVSLSGDDLSGVNLTGAIVGDCLTGLGEQQHCAGAVLTNATLTGATLTNANLTATSLVPSNQTVTATSPAGAVVTWSTPPSLPGATPGSCTPSSGSTIPISQPGSTGGLGPTTVTCQVLDDQGDVATGTFTVTVLQPPLPGSYVAIPSNGATVTGDSWLDAGAAGPVGIALVSFELSGGSLSSPQVISGSTSTPDGWIGAWNSTSVPNGTYSLESVATDDEGFSNTSAPVTITVDNPAPSTSVIIPSNEATQSGTTALLDATSTADVTSVSYELSGGTLSDQVIATGTATLYGWLAQWNTTSVPNGSYTLQSVGTYSGGTVTSAPITITVSN